MPSTGALVKKAQQNLHPLGAFVVFVAIAFLVEWLVMAFLPLIIDLDRNTALASVVDAGILVMVLGPLAWLMFIVPLRRLIDIRTRLLSKLLKAQEE